MQQKTKKPFGTLGIHSNNISEGNKPFSFHGDGFEFFKIWIVNVFLTIITLGIYSPWALVRTRKYFYGNTKLMDASFNYHANPVSILIGRIIAVVIYAVFVSLSTLNPIIAVVLTIVLLAVMPWILNKSLRFHAYNSSYKNIRFNFKGSYEGALMAFIIWPIIGTISLYALMPIAIKKQHEYIARNSLYGRSYFSMALPIGAVYAVFFIGLLIVITGSVAVYFLTSGLNLSLLGPNPIAARIFVAIYAAVPIWLIYNFVAMTNLTYNNLGIKQNRFQSTMTLGSYAGLIIVNLGLLIVTLGLALPWVKVRNAKYAARKLEFIASGDVQQFVQAETNDTTALGGEIGAVFDIGI